MNSIFEGNQQHDAHELLVCLLDNIRETCRQLSHLSERQRCIIPPQPPCPLPPAKSSFTSSVRKSLKLGKARTNGVLEKKHALGKWGTCLAIRNFHEFLKNAFMCIIIELDIKRSLKVVSRYVNRFSLNTMI